MLSCYHAPLDPMHDGIITIIARGFLILPLCSFPQSPESAKMDVVRLWMLDGFSSPC